ncbi:MAG: SUMF1/EgtB/PvdO family nonheme iron enzyme, partial [Lentisphaerae bacterium]|nr:SUMF1/EgtB/PvdO family nonheme iron enzyme [Lentisphaerota bacterium]
PDGRDSGYTLSARDTFGQYLIVRALGRGGMGEVYEVEHNVLHRRYALKLLPPDFAEHPRALERFRREAHVMANLEHLNILRVDDFGETEGRYWLRMELARGIQVRDETVVSLDELAKVHDGKIPQDEFVLILKQILDGLIYAHKHGTIHRDLKPANVLLTLTGAKIADFGLVKLTGEDRVRRQAELLATASMSVGEQPTAASSGRAGSSTPSLVGTFEYMSPEQKRGKHTDARSDIYAVGLMTFRLLTGRDMPGFRLPSQLSHGLFPQWDEVILRALAEDPKERYPSALEMRTALNQIGTSALEGRAFPAVLTLTSPNTHTCGLLQPTQVPTREAGIGTTEGPPGPYAERGPSPSLLDSPLRNASPSEEHCELCHLSLTVPRPGCSRCGRICCLDCRGEGEELCRDCTGKIDPREAGRAHVPSPAHEQNSPNWVLIAGGAFLFGRKRKELDLADFWMSVSAVSCREYSRFLKATGYSPEGHVSHLVGERPPDYPVANVTFRDAEAYALWLGGTLPTEEQWEKAGRGTDGRNYPWGDSFESSLCSSADSDGDGMMPVDALVSGCSPYSCRNMSGNVWEWTESFYGTSRRERVVRGGSYEEGKRLCSCFYREGVNSRFSKPDLGFRCVRNHPRTGVEHA